MDADQELTLIYFLNVTSQFKINAIQREVERKEEQNRQLQSYQAML